MKNLKFTVNVITVLFLVSLLSCGPNDQERLTAEKVKMDSIALAVRASIADSIAIANGVAALKKTKENTKDAIVVFKYVNNLFERKLDDNRIELEKVKSFQFGRAVSEKETQIASSLNDIKRLEKKLESNEAGIKIFKRALYEMEDVGSMHFKSYKDFQSYEKDLYDRIKKAESEILLDYELDQLNNFSFKKIIQDESFLRILADYKRGKMPDID